jgi:hypothetical protein
MQKLISSTALALLLAVSTSWAKDGAYTIDDVQGSWWASCDDPAAEFYISGDEYGGDFLGTHPVEVRNSVLTFKKGFVEGHSAEVTGVPVSFRILEASGSNLVLASVSKEHASSRRTLQACK